MTSISVYKLKEEVVIVGGKYNGRKGTIFHIERIPSSGLWIYGIWLEHSPEEWQGKRKRTRERLIRDNQVRFTPEGKIFVQHFVSEPGLRTA